MTKKSKKETIESVLGTGMKSLHGTWQIDLRRTCQTIQRKYPQFATKPYEQDTLASLCRTIVMYKAMCKIVDDVRFVKIHEQTKEQCHCLKRTIGNIILDMHLNGVDMRYLAQVLRHIK